MPARLKPVPILISALFVIGVLILIVKHEPIANESSGIAKKVEQIAAESRNDRHIHSVERFSQPFKMAGVTVTSGGADKHLEHTMVSSLIHFFSPYTENRFKEIMLEPRHEQRTYANSPALLWLDDELICVMRIWLEKEAYKEGKAEKPMNSYSDNYLYVQKYNRHMVPTTPGSVLGLPTPHQWTIGDGPIEPRLFAHKDDIYISFNTGVFLEDGHMLDGTFVWDFKRHKTIIPQIEGGSPIVKTTPNGRMPRDKHWTPYSDMESGELRMMYNLDPLRVMSCTLNFTCRFVHFEGGDDYVFEQTKDTLRGGTPWILYKHPYYFSIGHATMFKEPNWDRYYTINLIVYRATPKPRVVYVSGPIKIHSKPMNDIPMVRKQYIHDSFFFPVSLLQEDEDSIVIGGHINDFSSVLIRVRGVKQVLEDAVAADEVQPALMPGPPMGTLHKIAKEFAANVTKYKFFGLDL